MTKNRSIAGLFDAEPLTGWVDTACRIPGWQMQVRKSWKAGGEAVAEFQVKADEGDLAELGWFYMGYLTGPDAEEVETMVGSLDFLSHLTLACEDMAHEFASRFSDRMEGPRKIEAADVAGLVRAADMLYRHRSAVGGVIHGLYSAAADILDGVLSDRFYHDLGISFGGWVANGNSFGRILDDLDAAIPDVSGFGSEGLQGFMDRFSAGHGRVGHIKFDHLCFFVHSNGGVTLHVFAEDGDLVTTSYRSVGEYDLLVHNIREDCGADSAVEVGRVFAAAGFGKNWEHAVFASQLTA